MQEWTRPGVKSAMRAVEEVAYALAAIWGPKDPGRQGGPTPECADRLKQALAKVPRPEELLWSVHGALVDASAVHLWGNWHASVTEAILRSAAFFLELVHSMPLPELEQSLRLFRGTFEPVGGVVALLRKETAALLAKSPEPTMLPSEDFCVFTWGRQIFTFSPHQAKFIRLLWEEWRRSRSGLHERTLASKVDPLREDREREPPFRLRDQFRSRGRNHQAWGKLIVRRGDGIYGLAPP